jgi:mRNA interferase RelE/StbE
VIYEIEFKPAALRELSRLGRDLQERVAAAIDALGTNSCPPGSRKLRGASNLYRIRIGDYRVVYAINEETTSLLIIRIRHRATAYRRL